MLVTMIALFVFIIGICFGSFGNVLIFRVPKNKTILGRSKCMMCKRVLKWTELIPVLSFVMQRGLCRGCEEPLSRQYPIIELSSGVLFLLTFFELSPVTSGEILLAIATALALWLMLLIAVIDARTSEIPDLLNIPLLILGCGISLIAGREFIMPLLIGGGFFGLQWIISRGRYIGSGDIFLGAGIGALLGDLRFVLVWLLLSYIIGGFVAALLLKKKHTTLNSMIPFGPMLAGAGIAVALYGDWLVRLIGL